MRVILILIIIVVLMAIGGWLVFNFGNNSASVNVNSDKIKQDASQAVEATKALLNRAEENIEQAVKTK